MLFKHRTPQLFHLREPKRFRTTKLDIFVVTIVLIVYLWAFFIDSFKPMMNETDEIILIPTNRGFRAIPVINMQVFIGPIILVYEMIVLIMFDGKLKGRELPWRLYFLTFKIIIRNKFRQGMEEYREWRKLRRKIYG